MADLKISALTASTTPLAGTEVLPIVQSSTTKQVSVANLTAGRAVATSSVSTTAGFTLRGADFTSYELLRVLDGTVNPGLFVNARAATKDVQLYGSGSSVSGQRLMLGADSVVDSLRISATDITAAYGNLVIGTSGKGIDFSATASGSGTMTSELLADYEEGTWTPTLVGGTTAGTYSIATTSAYYTKIGRQVTVTARMVVTVTVAGTGFANFGGLPFAKSSAQFITGSVITTNVTYGLTVISVSVQATTSGSSSNFAFAGLRSATSPTDVAVTDIADQAVLIATFSYFV